MTFLSWGMTRDLHNHIHDNKGDVSMVASDSVGARARAGIKWLKLLYASLVQGIRDPFLLTKRAPTLNLSLWGLWPSNSPRLLQRWSLFPARESRQYYFFGAGAFGPWFVYLPVVCCCFFFLFFLGSLFWFENMPPWLQTIPCRKTCVWYVYAHLLPTYGSKMTIIIGTIFISRPRGPDIQRSIS